jgi:hypothetical protein
MYRFAYVDESFDNSIDLAVVALVLSPCDVSASVEKVLSDNGFQPGVDEFKTTNNFRAQPRWGEVRSGLLDMLHGEKCKVAVAIAAATERPRLGNLAISALTNVAQRNGISLRQLRVIFDQQMRRDDRLLREQTSHDQMIERETLEFGRDSRLSAGLQCADLIAGSVRFVLTEEMRQNPRYIIFGEEEGCAEGPHILSEEILMHLSWLFFADPVSPIVPDHHPLVWTALPRSVWCSPSISDQIRSAVEARLGSLWRGCGH